MVGKFPPKKTLLNIHLESCASSLNTEGFFSLSERINKMPWGTSMYPSSRKAEVKHSGKAVSPVLGNCFPVDQSS